MELLDRIAQSLDDVGRQGIVRRRVNDQHPMCWMHSSRTVEAIKISSAANHITSKESGPVGPSSETIGWTSRKARSKSISPRDSSRSHGSKV